jgi:hypothetical protein
MFSSSCAEKIQFVLDKFKDKRLVNCAPENKYDAEVLPLNACESAANLMPSSEKEVNLE